MEVEIYKMNYIKDYEGNYLRILGKAFVKNNKNKGMLIINNKRYKIKDVFLVNEIKQYKIKMVITKSICNRSYLFKDCESLVSISKPLIEKNIDNLDDDKESGKTKDYIENDIIEHLSPINLNNIDDLPLSNLTNINSTLISKTIGRNTNKALSLTNNSESVLENFTALKEMISNYKSLSSLSLSSISNFSSLNANTLNNILSNFELFPELYHKFRNFEVTNLDSMFYNCKSLIGT